MDFWKVLVIGNILKFICILSIDGWIYYNYFGCDDNLFIIIDDVINKILKNSFKVLLDLEKFCYFFNYGY